MQTSILAADKDPMGAAIADYFETGKAGTLRVFSSQFDEDEIPVRELFHEGCLSVEGFRGWVERPKEIEVGYYDRHGKYHIIRAEGYFARVFLHEMDHLDGILFCDKMLRKVTASDYEK